MGILEIPGFSVVAESPPQPVAKSPPENANFHERKWNKHGNHPERNEMQFDGSNRGAIFRNDKKQGDNDPDYRGSLDVGGVQHWVSAWMKTSSRTGERYMSLAVRAKDGDAKQPTRPAATPAQQPATRPVKYGARF